MFLSVCKVSEILDLETSDLHSHKFLNFEGEKKSFVLVLPQVFFINMHEELRQIIFSQLILFLYLCFFILTDNGCASSGTDIIHSEFLLRYSLTIPMES